MEIETSEFVMMIGIYGRMKAYLIGKIGEDNLDSEFLMDLESGLSNLIEKYKKDLKKYY